MLSRPLDGLKPIHSFPVHPLPPFAVVETIITACQCRTWQPGGIWLRRADRVKWLPLHTANQRMRGATGKDTVKRAETGAGCCCSAGTWGCWTDMQHAQHNCSKIKFDWDNCAVFWFEHSCSHLLWNITCPIAKTKQTYKTPKVIKLKKEQVTLQSDHGAKSSRKKDSVSSF